MSRQIALLVNPTAGKGRAARLIEPVTERLRRHGADVDVVVGRDADEAFDLCRARVAQGVDALVALGGDGLVNLAVQVLAATETPLGVVPAGTGNDIARALSIPLGDPVAAVDVVAGARARSIDLARAAGRWYVGVLGAGFDSMVNERANRMRWPHGRMRYNLAIVAELRTFRPLPFTLHLDGAPWETEAMLVAVANGPSYGGGMLVAPSARIDDGRLDVTVLGPVSKPEFVKVFPSVYRGSHIDHPAVSVRTAREVMVACDGVTAFADGERVAPLPVTCDVVPNALQALAPESAS